MTAPDIAAAVLPHLRMRADRLGIASHGNVACLDDLSGLVGLEQRGAQRELQVGMHEIQHLLRRLPTSWPSCSSRFLFAAPRGPIPLQANGVYLHRLDRCALTAFLAPPRLPLAASVFVR